MKKLSLDKRVIFLGKVSIFEKYYFLKNAQMMVHMSTAEGFGIAVLEGMSQGLPCIVSNSTALPYLVKDKINGFCIDPKNHKLLAEKIKFILDSKNKKVIRKIRKANLTITKNRTWEDVALKVEEFYKKIHIKTLLR